MAKHRSTKQEEILITKTRESLRRFAFSLFIPRFCFVPRNHSSLRNDKSIRQRLPRRAQKCALLAMTNLVGFAEKRNNFRNETFEKRRRAEPKNNRKKCKTSVIQIKTFQFCVIARSAATWQSLSDRRGIPWRSTGARSKKESLSQKTEIRRFILLPLSSF